MQLLDNCTTSENRSRRDPTVIRCEFFPLLITSLTELPSKFLEIRTCHDLSGLLQGKKEKWQNRELTRTWRLSLDDLFRQMCSDHSGDGSIPLMVTLSFVDVGFNSEKSAAAHPALSQALRAQTPKNAPTTPDSEVYFQLQYRRSDHRSRYLLVCQDFKYEERILFENNRTIEGRNPSIRSLQIKNDDTKARWDRVQITRLLSSRPTITF